MFTSVDVDLRITAGETMVLLLESVYDHDEVKNKIHYVYISLFLDWFVLIKLKRQNRSGKIFCSF